MAGRRALILAIVTLGAGAAIIGTPDPFKALTASGGLFLLAYVYAELTRSRGPRV